MDDEFICYSIIIVLSIWTVVWVVLTAGSIKDTKQLIDKAAAEGRKVSFWVTPKGQKIGTAIMLISIILWFALSLLFALYLNKSPLAFLFLSALAIIIFYFGFLIITQLFVVICRLLGFGKADK